MLCGLARAQARETAEMAWAQAKADARAMVHHVLRVTAQSPDPERGGRPWSHGSMPPQRKKISLARGRLAHGRSLSFDAMMTRNSPKNRARRDSDAAARDGFENAPLLLSLLREFRMWLGVGRSNVRRARVDEPKPLLRLIGPRACRSLRIWGGGAYAVPPAVALRQAQVRYLGLRKVGA